MEDGVVADLDVVGAFDETLLADEVFGAGLVELLLFIGHLSLEDVQGFAAWFLLTWDYLAWLTLAYRTHHTIIIITIKYHINKYNS